CQDFGNSFCGAADADFGAGAGADGDAAFAGVGGLVPGEGTLEAGGVVVAFDGGGLANGGSVDVATGGPGVVGAGSGGLVAGVVGSDVAGGVDPDSTDASGSMTAASPIRPRVSASRPTVAHPASATASQALPGRWLNRCCASQRNILAPARHPAAPINSKASRLNRAGLRPGPVTQACRASTA